MNSNLKDKNMEYLFKAILSLETQEECSCFFNDICTMPELRAIAQRLHVARMLSEGRVYTDIAAQTGASTATISRVNRSLNYGDDGYKIVLERLKG